jgi:DNA-binding transcriptional ArsR family regulator
MSGAPEPNRKLANGIPRPGAADCIKAIGTAQRRHILRILHQAEEARSPSEIAEAFEVSVSHIAYHVKVLRECRALALTDTRPRRGAMEHFYASTIIDNELVVRFLDAAKAEDE